MNIEIIDIVVGAIFAYALVHGFFKGLVQQLGALGGLVVAILFANLFSPLFESLLNKTNLAGTLAHKLAYLISFLILMFACHFLARLLKKTLHMVHLGGIDRLFGSLFCGFKYILTVSVLLNLYTLLNTAGSAVPAIPEKAELCQLTLKVAPTVIDWSKEKVEMPEINIPLPEIKREDLPDFLQ